MSVVSAPVPAIHSSPKHRNLLACYTALAIDLGRRLAAAINEQHRSKVEMLPVRLKPDDALQPHALGAVYNAAFNLAERRTGLGRALGEWRGVAQIVISSSPSYQFPAYHDVCPWIKPQRGDRVGLTDFTPVFEGEVPERVFCQLKNAISSYIGEQYIVLKVA